jgi:hypothetical protein
MYPYRDPVTELCGYAAGKQWIVAPAFEYAQPFTHQRAIVQKTEGDFWCLTQDLQFISLEPVVAGLVKDARIKEVSNFNDNPAESFAWYLKVEHGQEVSFVLLDHELKPTILKTIPKELPHQFYSDSGWLLLSIRESGKWKYFSFHPQTLEQKMLPNFKSYFASKDGYWVVAAINKHDDPQSEFVTLGEFDKYAYFSIETMERISEWYPYASSFSEGLSILLNSQDQYVFVDSKLKPVEELRFHYAQPFREGFTRGSRRNESGYFAKDGKLVIRLDPDDDLGSFDRFGHALIRTGIEERGFLIDRRGKKRLENLRSCDFFDGDYPFYEVSYEGHDSTESLYLKPDLSKAITVIY